MVFDEVEVVRVWDVAIFIAPAPPIEPIVSVASTSYVAPELIEMSVLPSVPVVCKVPAEIVVAPV